ncbi:MAG: Maf family protein [Gammaproteobacteria bacterium]
MKKLVLASGSRYRQDLLKKLRLEFIVCNSQLDETPRLNEAPDALAVRLSIAKAHAVVKDYPAHYIIGSDQVAAFENRTLGKPGDLQRAIDQLRAQSGKKVSFYTGLCVLNSETGEYLTDIDVCNVYFRSLDARQILHYLKIDQPFDCAGSFKSEGYGITLFDKIEGEDPNALIGLPLIKLVRLLSQFGWRIP